MRENSPRETLLQNLLAVSSVLLYRSTKLLHDGTMAARESLVIEIEEWFAESQAAIEQQLIEDNRNVLPIPNQRQVGIPWRPPLDNVPILDEDAVKVSVALNYFLGG